VNAKVLQQRLAADADVPNAPQLVRRKAHEIRCFVGLCSDHELPIGLCKRNPRDLDLNARMSLHERSHACFKHGFLLAFRGEGVPHGERHFGGLLGLHIGGFSLKASRQHQQRDQQGRGQTTQVGSLHARSMRPTSGFSVDRIHPGKQHRDAFYITRMTRSVHGQEGGCDRVPALAAYGCDEWLPFRIRGRRIGVAR